ncbi:MAG: ribosomal-protein-alanine N-acetyltransferase [Ruminococcaceae bacterium]|nr:ribosomal-protein-alanine N-acetyltransferase [Oscillospiraceae bacterium]
MIEIINMTAAHVAQIAEIEKLCFSDPWSENSVASELNNPLSLWLVALDGATVAGYVGSQSVLDGADMMNIAVHPDYRRRGIAWELVTGLADALAEKGVKSLALEVRQSNAPAIALYEQLGFQQVGLRPNYYRNPKENALIMRKEL